MDMKFVRSRDSVDHPAFDADRRSRITLHRLVNRCRGHSSVRPFRLAGATTGLVSDEEAASQARRHPPSKSAPTYADMARTRES